MSDTTPSDASVVFGVFDGNRPFPPVTPADAAANPIGWGLPDPVLTPVPPPPRLYVVPCPAPLPPSPPSPPSARPLVCLPEKPQPSRPGSPTAP